MAGSIAAPARSRRRPPPRWSRRPVIYWCIVVQIALVLTWMTLEKAGIPSGSLHPLAIPIVAVGLWNLKILDRARRRLD